MNPILKRALMIAGLVVIDIVTNRKANLHNEIMQVLGRAGEYEIPAETNLYAVAYRPIVRANEEQIDTWPWTLDLGRPLPKVPLALDAELVLPVDLDVTYTAACQRRRLG